MANKNSVTKKHSEHRAATVAKAGRRAHFCPPPSPKLEEDKAKWVAKQVINGILGYDEALRQVKPNSITEANIEGFLTHLANKPDTNPIIKLRIKRYL